MCAFFVVLPVFDYDGYWDFSRLFSVLPVSTFLFFIGYSTFPKLRYLERNKIEKPTFKAMCSSEINVPEDFEFSRLKTEIAEKWLITFSDDAGCILKFRNKLKVFNWGAGAWIKYNHDTRKLYLECFPIDNYLESAKKMQKEIENCIELNDLFALTLARDNHIESNQTLSKMNN